MKDDTTTHADDGEEALIAADDTGLVSNEMTVVRSAIDDATNGDDTGSDDDEGDAPDEDGGDES